ncbi:GNAT family N-acetyltransferase [uncultured Shimia sp.]|uniref:GNAT family N-acetyltransferase n=1 Tax=uncultured Shimia sp. TaxID=573152 RepID=UPI0026267E63|nr:GNAT family N-acetyltransferase [uncultured Shimia sp.]
MGQSGSVTTRKATVRDAPDVARLVQGLLEELGGTAVDPEPLLTTTRTLMTEQVVIALIAEAGDQPIGVLMLNECAAIYAGGRFGQITELYVTPDNRSGGVAVALLAEARRVAQQSGWERFEVGAPDQPAWNRTLQFYLREGFEEVGPRLRQIL